MKFISCIYLFLSLHNIVCFAHVNTGSVFIAAPAIPIVKGAKKSPVSDLQNNYVCFNSQVFFVNLQSKSIPSPFYAHSKSFQTIPIKVMCL